MASCWLGGMVFFLLKIFLMTMLTSILVDLLSKYGGWIVFLFLAVSTVLFFNGNPPEVRIRNSVQNFFLTSIHLISVHH